MYILFLFFLFVLNQVFHFPLNWGCCCTGYSQILKPEDEDSKPLLSWQAFLKWSSFSPPNQLTLPQGPQRQGGYTPAQCPEHRLLQVSLGSHSLTVPAFQKNSCLEISTSQDSQRASCFLWKQSILSTSFCKFHKTINKDKTSVREKKHTRKIRSAHGIMKSYWQKIKLMEGNGKMV